MAKKEKQFKVKFIKDVNGAWSGAAYMRNTDNSVYTISAAAMPGMKSATARKEVAAMLNERCEEYAAETGATRIEKEAI